MERTKSKEELEAIAEEKKEVSKKVKDFIVRAHSFQEMGTEELPDENYDVLHFPHLILAAGVIMSVYGYFIILVSTGDSNLMDGIIILTLGTVISTLGMLRLLSRYWASFFILLLLSGGLVFTMMALWDFVIYPSAEQQGLIADTLKTTDSFIVRFPLVLLTTFTFAYTACFVWYLLARFTSTMYYKIFASSKEKSSRFFIVDPWRKTLQSKGALVGDILNRVYIPFFFLLSIIMTISAYGDLLFIQVNWGDYFETVLLTYFLLCAMVVLFPAFWLLDYVRFYDENRLEVKSLGQRVLILVKGYAGFGTIFTFITRTSQNFFGALLEFYMMALYLIPSLILLIGGYVLLTERDVYYIASKVPHGDKVIVDFKMIDSIGEELEWWLKTKQGEKRGFRTKGGFRT